MTDDSDRPSGDAVTGDGDPATAVVKLGGSVITRKDEPETVDDEALAAAADAVADVWGTSTGDPASTAAADGRANVASSDATDGTNPRLVLVHGGGSFGHHHAAEHGVTEDDGTTDATAAGAIHDAMAALNRRVVGALRDRGVPAMPVHPLSVTSRDATGELSLPTVAVRALLAEGFVPVAHGDVVAHAGEGATVLSGDEIVVALAAAIGADRVGVCSTVPGVLDAEGAVVDRIGSLEAVADVLGGSDATDVTGGMAGKVRALLGVGVPAQIFGPDDLAGFLAGEAPGTTVDGGD